MAVSTTSNVTDIIKIYNIRRALSYAMPKFVYPQFGQQDMLPEREGKNIKWVRFSRLSVPSSALSESPSWSPETLATSTVTTILELWGNGVEYTELLAKTTYLDDFPEEVRRIVGENAGETINAGTRDVIKAGTQVYYANGKTEATFTSADKIDLDDILEAVNTLETNDARRITQIGVIDKSQIEGDMPADGIYVAFISPAVKKQLMKDTAFRDATRYLRESLFSGHLCTIDGVAFLVTSTAPTRSNVGSASSVATADQTIIVGDEAYGIPHLTRDLFEIVVTPPGGHGDEYAVKTAVAWKAYYKSVILNENWLIRVESAR